MYKFSRKKQLGQDAIPTTSLADMMFLLLIFFIMTTTLSRVTGFVSEMPAGSSASQSGGDKTPTVTIQGEEIKVDEEAMTLPGLHKRLKGLHLELKAGDARIVMVTASGNVKYQTYFETLAVIQSCSGIVAIVSEEIEEKR